MLIYIDTYKTGADESCHTITETHYFYESITGIMYIQCAYPHNLSLRDPAIPLVKPDGTYLTHQEWLATIDDERDRRELKR